MVQVNLTASTGLHSLEDFRDLIVKQANGAVSAFRRGQRRSSHRGYNTNISYNGQNSIAMSIDIAPDANLLGGDERRSRVCSRRSSSQLPQGLEGAILYDASQFVDSGHRRSGRTIIEAPSLFVTLVVFVFLGSLGLS